MQVKCEKTEKVFEMNIYMCIKDLFSFSFSFGSHVLRLKRIEMTLYEICHTNKFRFGLLHFSGALKQWIETGDPFPLSRTIVHLMMNYGYIGSVFYVLHKIY